MSEIIALRRKYHQTVCQTAIYLKRGSIASIADVGSKLSRKLAAAMLERIGLPLNEGDVTGQAAGKHFEAATRTFLEEAFRLLEHLRPGEWLFSVQGDIAHFAQYQHLARLNRIIASDKELRTTLGDYVVKPDILVARTPVSDEEINRNNAVVAADSPPKLTPFRASNSPRPTSLLHASISCKLTLRSDRSQNARTEALNLIRNRKGHTPHIVVVTAEPMPTRIASLALGTGDIDCVYHFALPELMDAARDVESEAALDALEIMIDGDRLRDIADLPFDLAV